MEINFNIRWVLINSLAIIIASAVALLALALKAETSQPETLPSKPELGISGIYNLKMPAPGILVGGQPEPRHFSALAESGVKHVINLRPKSEQPNFPEQKLVSAAGMSYHLLPVASTDDLSLKNIQTLDKLLQQAGDEKVLIHCASGNRVGAMMALRSALIYGEESESAITEGKAWGMTSLEPVVRQMLTGGAR